ncbi:hypothetical protein [Saccharothrix hoggarensis]|uniref:Uncharacterized protein n=1 Tax=Saccharothrix hoggarensis TaxID=913853 RepID=A0ABW3R1J4_9PSEU
MLLTGAVAALAVGGFVALSQVRRPPGGLPNVTDLPLADVPAPTDRPVEVVYCAGWDSAARAPVSPMAESVARAQDAAGAQGRRRPARRRGGAGGRGGVLVGPPRRAVARRRCRSPYRGVAYRRWPDGRLRLFEVRSWNYAGPGAAEFEDDEPTFRARVRRDASAVPETVGITAVRSDGSTLQTVRDWPSWPERVQPPEDVPLPAVDGWPALFGMTGPTTVRPGPAVVPTHFP